MKIKLFELEKLLSGKLILNGDRYSPFTSIELNLSVDSRKIKDDEVFVCIKKFGIEISFDIKNIFSV